MGFSNQTRKQGGPVVFQESLKAPEVDDKTKKRSDFDSKSASVMSSTLSTLLSSRFIRTLAKAFYELMKVVPNAASFFGKILRSFLYSMTKAILSLLLAAPSEEESTRLSAIAAQTSEAEQCEEQESKEYFKFVGNMAMRKLSDASKEKLKEGLCPICLEACKDCDSVELRCSHFYHKTCLESWSSFGNLSCPTCRTDYFR